MWQLVMPFHSTRRPSCKTEYLLWVVFSHGKLWLIWGIQTRLTQELLYKMWNCYFGFSWQGTTYSSRQSVVLQLIYCQLFVWITYTVRCCDRGSPATLNAEPFEQVSCVVQDYQAVLTVIAVIVCQNVCRHISTDDHLMTIHSFVLAWTCKATFPTFLETCLSKMIHTVCLQAIT